MYGAAVTIAEARTWLEIARIVNVVRDTAVRIPTVYLAFAHEGRGYIVMEYITGPWTQHPGAVRLPNRVDLVAEVSAGLPLCLGGTHETNFITSDQEDLYAIDSVCQTRTTGPGQMVICGDNTHGKHINAISPLVTSDHRRYVSCICMTLPVLQFESPSCKTVRHPGALTPSRSPLTSPTYNRTSLGGYSSNQDPAPFFNFALSFSASRRSQITMPALENLPSAIPSLRAFFIPFVAPHTLIRISEDRLPPLC
ncbi:hypothetical protein OF83DRAFT_1134428 [Amylostereum chailletii]|nr:hypothetical protein OF83DRAFT_1134428 [Amylostereum chailletii]